MNATTYIDLAGEVAIPEDGTISRTLFQDERLKAVVFGFAPGQELSEHTASIPAVLHFLEGKALVTLDGQPLEAGPGTWVHMPGGLPHAILAKSPVKMLLLLLKGE